MLLLHTFSLAVGTIQQIPKMLEHKGTCSQKDHLCSRIPSCPRQALHKLTTAPCSPAVGRALGLSPSRAGRASLTAGINLMTSEAASPRSTLHLWWHSLASGQGPVSEQSPHGEGRVQLVSHSYFFLALAGQVAPFSTDQRQTGLGIISCLPADSQGISNTASQEAGIIHVKGPSQWD